MTAAPVLLTSDAARALVTQFNASVAQTQQTVKQAVRQGLSDVRPIIAAFISGRGWQALGYARFEDCAPVEFGYSRGHLYRLAEAADILDELQETMQDGAVVAALFGNLSEQPALPDVSPFSDTALADLPTGVVMKLAELPDGASKVQALTLATALAKGATPSGKQVEIAVKQVKTELEADADRRAVEARPYVLVKQMMREGKISPRAARMWVDALDGLQPRKLVGHMLKHCISDPAVIRRLAESAKSATYTEIISTGQLQFVDAPAIPIAKATVGQVQALFSERNKEHREQGAAISQGHFIFSGRIVEIDPDGKTITFRVSPGALKGLPTGVELTLDARWDLKDVEIEEAA